MGPTPEALALADYLIAKLGLSVDRIALAYACMEHVELAFGAELDADDAATQPPHQDRGEVSTEKMVSEASTMVEEALDYFEKVGDDGDREYTAAIRAHLRKLTAALTEVKQQGPGEAVAALKLALEYWEHRQQRYRNRHPAWVDAARKVIESSSAPQGEAKRQAGEGMSYWAVQMPGKLPKLYGAHAIAELNWYPNEGGDLVRLQEVERIAATPAASGEEGV